MTKINYSTLVIIPAFNEEKSIEKVIKDISKNCVTHIVVVDNASTDNTAEKARMAGAIVLYEKNKGYGYACLKGIEFAQQIVPLPEIIVFLDGDYSDYPEQISELIMPIIENDFDMVI